MGFGGAASLPSAGTAAMTYDVTLARSAVCRRLRGVASNRRVPGCALVWRDTEDEMRLRSMALFGIGYLVGTRAGHDRYEQIAGRVREVSSSDVVRGYVDRAFDVARRPLAALGDTDATSEQAVPEDASEDDGDRDETESGSRARRSK
jgi:hypothetical protein